MRVSSATFPFSSGTLKSTRTKTRFPGSWRSRIESLFIERRFSGKNRRLQLAGHELDQVAATAGVTPFVVVPRQHLGAVSRHHPRVSRIHDRRVRIAAKIDGDEILFLVLENAL